MFLETLLESKDWARLAEIDQRAEVEYDDDLVALGILSMKHMDDGRLYTASDAWQSLNPIDVKKGPIAAYSHARISKLVEWLSSYLESAPIEA